MLNKVVPAIAALSLIFVPGIAFASQSKVIKNNPKIAQATMTKKTPGHTNKTKNSPQHLKTKKTMNSPSSSGKTK